MSQVAMLARTVLCSSQRAAGVSTLRNVFLQAFTTSSRALQAEPLPVASETANGVPRWIRELGVIRTDWT